MNKGERCGFALFLAARRIILLIGAELQLLHRRVNPSLTQQVQVA
jgi:hypothetical protein